MKTTRLFKIGFLLTVCLLCALLFASCAGEGGAATDDFYYEDMGVDDTLEKPEEGFSGDGSVTTPDGSLQDTRKIIKTYHLTAETKDFDAALEALKQLVEQNGGYVESGSVSQNAYGSSNVRYATYTLRIPAEHSDAFVGALGGSMNVTKNEFSVDDVSETYYSTEAILEELEAERDSLLAMMASIDSATDYDFWLTLQQRLSDVKQEIAVYRRTLMNYDSQVAYSTVSLTLHEVATYTPVEEESFGTRLADAFASGWSAFVFVSEQAILVLATLSPFLLPLLPIGIVLLVLILIAFVIILKKRKRS